MNYLAHIFLSGSNRKVQLGNFVGDAVKGSSYKNYPPDIAKGIQLHRAIDDYTDHHPAVCEVVHRLQPEFGRYSGVLLDIYFDYLLASRFESFFGVSLRRYTRTFYLSLLINYRYLPLRFKRFIWHFDTLKSTMRNCLLCSSHFLLNCRGFALNISIIISHNFKDEEGMNIVSARN